MTMALNANSFFDTQFASKLCPSRAIFPKVELWFWKRILKMLRKECTVAKEQLDLRESMIPAQPTMVPCCDADNLLKVHAWPLLESS